MEQFHKPVSWYTLRLAQIWECLTSTNLAWTEQFGEINDPEESTTTKIEKHFRERREQKNIWNPKWSSQDKNYYHITWIFEAKNDLTIYDVKKNKIIFVPQNACHVTFSSAYSVHYCMLSLSLRISIGLALDCLQYWAKLAM